MAMVKYFNRIYVQIATTGTGTVTFGSVIDASFMTPAEAAAASGDRVRYILEEGSDFELGVGTMGSSALTMTRDTVEVSKIGGAVGVTKMSLGGTATLRIVASAVDYGIDNLHLHGSDIASASTINLDTATGDVVDVTGTTPITAVTLSDGRERTVRFTGALTLTHGASLVLPGAANITTVAGDYAIFRGYAAGVVRCVGYFPTTVTGTGGAVRATAPTIAGGAHTGITSLAIRDTSAAFDVTLAATSSTTLTAGRTLTLDVVNAARTVKLGGNLTLLKTMSFTAADDTGVYTLPTGTATLAALASPTFTGTPAAPTPGTNVNTTQIVTGAWVNTYFGALAAANHWTGASAQFDNAVGIGTAASYPLHVRKDSGAYEILSLDNQTAGTYTLAHFINGANFIDIGITNVGAAVIRMAGTTKFTMTPSGDVSLASNTSVTGVNTGALQVAGDIWAGGTIAVGTYTATPGSITGYITIKDSGGTSRKIAVTS